VIITPLIDSDESGIESKELSRFEDEITTSTNKLDQIENILQLKKSESKFFELSKTCRTPQTLSGSG